MPLSHTTTVSWLGEFEFSAIAGMAMNADAETTPTVAIVIQAHRRRCERTGWGVTVGSLSMKATALPFVIRE